VDSGTPKKSLTPAEVFDYRLAALLGFADVEEMKRSMTQRAYLGWQRYWEEEPWGPYRDNLHAAMIAREVRRPYLRKGAPNKLDDFMVVNPQRRKAEATGNLIDFLKLIATKKPRQQ
jgi:hypothetical protein